MRLFFFFILVLSSFRFYAQYETSKWYFGNKAGFNFERARLKVVDDSNMNAPAACASITNDEGLLMFYSNGRTVWNRNHEVMTNGEGLAGDPNNFQSTLIIPKPGNENTYYLIYSRAEPSIDPLLTPGTFYSEIKFNDANPLGFIDLKNGFLDSNAPSEKLTAVHHKNGETFWLLLLTGDSADNALPKNTFKAFHITDEGINRPAVTTNSEVNISTFGSMKFSPNRKSLLVTGKSSEDNLRYVHLFDFNNETGEIEYVRNIITEPPFTNWPPKGVEFSPNGKYFYVSFDTGDSNGIIQYQLGDVTIGVDPISYITFTQDYKIESLQIANDQKIYVALHSEDTDSEFIGVINNPNEKGMAANYVQEAVRIAPGISTKGLPNFIQSYFASKIVTENKCYTEEFSFDAESYANISSVFWDFGDGTSGSGLSTKHIYDAPGSYIVKGEFAVGSKVVTVFKNVNAFAIPILVENQILEECDQDFDGLSTFNLNNIAPKISSIKNEEALFFYLSLDDLISENPIINPENFQNTEINQEIFVKVVNENNCSDYTSFRVNAKFVPLENVPDFFTCENSDGLSGDGKGLFNTDDLEAFVRSKIAIDNNTTLKFYPTFMDAQTDLNEFKKDFVISTSTIFIKAQEQDLSCGGIQSFNLIVNSEPKINLQESYTICFDPSVKPPVIISAELSNNRFEWRNSLGTILSTSSNFTVNGVGDFSLTVYKNENGLVCSNSQTFSVVNPEIPTFFNINVNTEDETNNIVDISVNGNSNYEFSLDNINFIGAGTSHTFTDVEPGLRTVYARDLDTCEQPIQTIVSVVGFKKFFTPNGDGDNDFWNIRGLDETSFKSINVRIFDRFGKIIAAITEFKSLGWDGTFNGKEAIENSYWFKAEIVDINDNIIDKSGNFSLIR